MIKLILTALFILDVAVTDSAVDFINNTPGLTWKAKEYPKEFMDRFEHFTPKPYVKPENLKVSQEKNDDLPENFDSRDKWPGQILGVRDVYSCDGSWAMSSVGAYGSAMTMAGCGQGHMSASDLLRCTSSSNGCAPGGTHLKGITQLRMTGAANETCLPFEDFVPPTVKPQQLRLSLCPSLCSDLTPVTRVRLTRHTPVTYGQEQQKIYDYGILVASMNFHELFINYASGIYADSLGAYLGEIYVQLIGWGVENGTLYWLAQNSWGENWGENGYFRILRGQNFCGIESSTVYLQMTCQG